MVWLKGKEPRWYLSNDAAEVLEGALKEIEDAAPACSDASLELQRSNQGWRDELRRLQALARVALKRAEDLRRAPGA